jgi:hypothetical protein
MYALRIAHTFAVNFRSLLVELRDQYRNSGHTPSSIDREEFTMRWSLLTPGNDSLRNLQHDGLASIDAPKYEEFCAGAEDGSDESSASNVDDKDRNDVERDVQDIVIQI